MNLKHVYLTNERFACVNKIPSEKNEVAIVGNYKSFAKLGKARCSDRVGVVVEGGFYLKVLIKVGRCIKVLQISSESLMTPSILQVA